jgi:bifunctional DNA-binding transcriptional regulator/antitoxin component of YhaV-PrlF toxin-antitoxin module
MVIARSKLTAQGQISVPAEVRRHRALFPEALQPRKLEDLDEGAQRYVKVRHARR